MIDVINESNAQFLYLIAKMRKFTISSFELKLHFCTYIDDYELDLTGAPKLRDRFRFKISLAMYSRPNDNNIFSGCNSKLLTKKSKIRNIFFFFSSVQTGNNKTYFVLGELTL